MRKDNKSQIVEYSYSNRTCFICHDPLSFKIIHKANSKFNLKTKETENI